MITLPPTITIIKTRNTEPTTTITTSINGDNEVVVVGSVVGEPAPVVSVLEMI